MELTLAEKISLKTKQVVMKADHYVRENDPNGLSTASKHGLLLAATSISLAILGVTAMIMTAGATAPLIPGVASVAAIAGLPALTIGGVSLNVAGATLFGGAVAGAGLSFFSKVASTVSQMISGEKAGLINSNGEYYTSNYVHGKFEVIKKDGDRIEVSRAKILKSIADKTFQQKYESIVAGDGSHHVYKMVDEADFVNLAAKLPYISSFDDKIMITPSDKNAENEAEIIRREVLLNTKDMKVAKSAIFSMKNLKEVRANISNLRDESNPESTINLKMKY